MESEVNKINFIEKRGEQSCPYLLLQAQQYEQHRDRPGAFVPPGMAGGALDHDIMGGQMFFAAFIEFQPDFTIQHDGVVERMRAVHAGMLALEQFREPRKLRGRFFSGGERIEAG